MRMRVGPPVTRKPCRSRRREISARCTRRAQRRNSRGKRTNCLGSSMRKDLFMSNAYDAIIVGTGQAGPPLAGRLSAAGMKVAIIERKLFGGTCVNTGYTPIKTLGSRSYPSLLWRQAADFVVL